MAHILTYSAKGFQRAGQDFSTRVGGAPRDIRLKLNKTGRLACGKQRPETDSRMFVWVDWGVWGRGACGRFAVNRSKMAPDRDVPLR